MDNPFESGHIKNYVLAYASIVVIMILFFIASTLFLEDENIEQKEFEKGKRESLQEIRTNSPQYIDEQNKTRKFKLLDKAY